MELRADGSILVEPVIERDTKGVPGASCSEPRLWRAGRATLRPSKTADLLNLVAEVSDYNNEASMYLPIAVRVERLSRWIRENAPDCECKQEHLDEGTAARAYWHYGYVCALKDVLKWITKKSIE